MPTKYDYVQKWLDGMFNPNYDPFLELEKIAAKCGIEVDNKKQTITVKNPVNPFEIQSVLSNRKKNAFTVVWADGTHTTVHCQSGDKWDDEKALAMCFTKKALGNKGNFNDKFNDALDNKMKTIHTPESAKELILAEEKFVYAKKKECDCDGTCTECKCKKESFADAVEKLQSTRAKTEDLKNAFGLNKQTVEDLQKSAGKATSSFTEMVEAFANMSDKTEGEPEPAHIYKVYIKTGGEPIFDCNIYSIEELRKRVHTLARKLYGREPYYYRTWMSSNGRMQIDFGHYTKFIEVEGITPDEYAKH